MLTPIRFDGSPVVNREPEVVYYLTEDQIDMLTGVLIEECGVELTDDQITDQVVTLLEDVPGFETASDDTLSQTINRVRSAYHVATSR